MEKIYKILAVFGLLMIAITYSMTARAQRFREYYFSRRLPPPLLHEPGQELLSALVGGGEGIVEAEDREDRLVFSRRAEGEKNLLVTDWQNGNYIAEIPLEDNADAIIFDPRARLIFSYSTEGALTIIRQTNRSVYKVVQRMLLPKNGEGIAVDTQTGRVYLSAGGFVFEYTNQ